MLFSKRKSISLDSFFPSGFVDIHSHLLPGIDDGAEDLEDSMSLITKMYSFGIKNFITTPHILGDIYPNSSETILESLQTVRQELSERGFKDIRFGASAEYMMDEQFCKLLSNNDILALKDNYILVEISYLNAPINLYEILYEIQLKGYKPILAHPERYRFYHSDFKNYDKLKKSGCLFQLNLLSLTKYYGNDVQRVSQKLLKQNKYDFVGTDTHNTKHLKSLEQIATQKIKSKIEHLLENNKLFI